MGKGRMRLTVPFARSLPEVSHLNLTIETMTMQNRTMIDGKAMRDRKLLRRFGLTVKRRAKCPFAGVHRALRVCLRELPDKLATLRASRVDFVCHRHLAHRAPLRRRRRRRKIPGDAHDYHQRASTRNALCSYIFTRRVCAARLGLGSHISGISMTRVPCLLFIQPRMSASIHSNPFRSPFICTS